MDARPERPPSTRPSAIVAAGSAAFPIFSHVAGRWLQQTWMWSRGVNSYSTQVFTPLEGDTRNSISYFSFTTPQCKRASKTMYSPWVAFCAGP
eukprot:372492-Prymnesium_polylepis.1